MRQALYQHDFITVYRLLQRIGYSQNAIGQLTGQSQPEISAILHGRRVISYSVIARIADGLGIPRGYLGLSWCDCT
jgi:transcriptional regulator with XRE-family HTH domain